MKIGVLGSGNVGQTLASGFLKHGHQAMLGTRDPHKPEVKAWLEKNPSGATGTFEEAARFGEFLVLATVGGAAIHALELAGAPNLAGKTIMDATNPIAGPPVGGILPFTTGPNDSLAEAIQRAYPAAHIVKAFNSVGFPQMINPHYQQGTPTMFYCGDDAAAKQQVAAVITQFGWEPFDCGGVTAARAIEPLCILWCLRGFQHNQWNHAFRLLTE